MIDPGDMILLAEVAEARSFTAAGLRLGMPKSTVSQRIAKLEQLLDLKLLNRSTRQVSLTSAGLIFLEHCQRVRAEVQAGATAMGNVKDQPAGALRITCPEVTATYFMPDLLHRFAQAFPRITVQLIATNRPLDIVGERIDFAFRVGEVTDQTLIIRRLSSIRRILVASPTYLATAATPSHPADLREHRCLLHDAQPDWRFQSHAEVVTLQPPAAIRSDSMGFLLQSAITGSGIALLPAYVCHASLRAGVLHRLLPDWSTEASHMMLVSAHVKHQSSAQRAFRDCVKRYDFAQMSGK